MIVSSPSLDPRILPLTKITYVSLISVFGEVYKLLVFSINKTMISLKNLQSITIIFLNINKYTLIEKTIPLVLIKKYQPEISYNMTKYQKNLNNISTHF
jgi:hypothetical protein